MGKLIHADTLANFQSKFTKYADSTDPSYYSIAFTDNGYLVTHGKIFALSVASEDGNTSALKLSLSGNSLTLTGNAIDTSVTLPSYTASGVLTAAVTDTTNNVTTITHNKPTTALTTTNTYGTITDLYKINVPQIKVDEYGHITSISNLSAVDTSLVKQSAAGSNMFYLLGTTSSQEGVKDTYFNSNVYVSDGAINASNFVMGGTALNRIFAGISTKAKVSTSDSDLGLVTLSDTYSTYTTKELAGVAATPYAVNEAYKAAVASAKELFTINDAMIFVGTINAAGVIQSINSNVVTTAITTGTDKLSKIPTHKEGWTFKFTDAGTFTFLDGTTTATVEAGDMLICVKDGSNTEAVYTIIQANIENALFASNATPSGLLYTTGSLEVSAFDLSKGNSGQLLASTGSGGLQWVNDTNTWRSITVGSTTLDDTKTTLTIANNTGISLDFTDGKLTITNSSPLSSATNLALKGTASDGTTSVSGTYNPKSTAQTLTFSTGLTSSYSSNTFTVSLASVLSSAVSSGLYKIAVDKYGRITSTTAVTTSDLAGKLNSLTIGTSSKSLAFNGSTAQSILFAGGTDISWAYETSTDGNTLTLKPSVTHKYKAISYTNDGSTNVTVSATGVASMTFVAGDNITFGGTASSNKLIINSKNTWRNVNAYLLSGLKTSGDTIDEVLQSTGTSALTFGDEFTWDDSNTDATKHELKLVWTEVSGSTVTYHV